MEGRERTNRQAGGGEMNFFVAANKDVRPLVASSRD